MPSSAKRRSSRVQCTDYHIIDIEIAGVRVQVADFEEGAYVDSRFGTTYEFGPEGQGRLIGGVPGTPTFTYEVDGDQVITSGGLGLTFERIDSKTLERPDGTRFVLQESP